MRNAASSTPAYPAAKTRPPYARTLLRTAEREMPTARNVRDQLPGPLHVVFAMICAAQPDPPRHTYALHPCYIEHPLGYALNQPDTATRPSR